MYAFLKPAGRYGIEGVPRGKAFVTDNLAQAIISKNGLLSKDLATARGAVERAREKSPQAYWLHARSGGWQRDLKAFAHRGQIFGRGQTPGIVLKPPLSDLARKFPLAQKGRADAWELVTWEAHRSSRLRLALCVAFAAPLLKVVDLQSFSIVLAGRSKTGKSTALLAASSVIGIGLEGSLPNFNATPAALQEVAVEFVDRVLPVNELGLLKGSKRDAYHQLRPLTYRYSEGRDTARHSKSSYGQEGAPLEWRGIMLVSSENTFEELAAMAGEKRDEGEYARAFDVPAVTRGRTTIFDRFPRKLAASDRERWSRDRIIKLRQLIGRHHGHAFDAYAEFPVKNRDHLHHWTETAMKSFTETLSGLKLSGALQHASRNFALLFAGATLAYKAGLTPSWKHDATLNDLRRCFLDGLSVIREMQTIEMRVRKTLLKRLPEIAPSERLVEANTAQGWFDEEGGQRVYKIRTPAFNGWFASLTGVRAAIQWLLQSQLLIVKDGAKPDPLNLEWAGTFPKLKEQGHRCYQFRDPATST